MKAIEKTYKVYNSDPREGSKSGRYDFSDGQNVRIIELIDTDKNLTIVKITRPTEEECDRTIWGQINDGFFENCYVFDWFPIETKEVNI